MVGDLAGAEADLEAAIEREATLAAAWANGDGEPPQAMIMDDHDHFSIAAQLESPQSELSTAMHRQMGVA